MVRVGEDISEKLDIVPAQFFVHRHIRGKWACKCCQALVQEPVEPHIIDKGMPAEGLIAHTLVVRFDATVRGASRVCPWRGDAARRRDAGEHA